jgi:ubiquinone/menaquinone biosynthesis C-methylase UbiE
MNERFSARRIISRLASTGRTLSGNKAYAMPGSEAYRKQIREEIDHYTDIFKDETARQTLVQTVPPSWTEVEVRTTALVRAATGAEMADHVLSRLYARPGMRLLSLGAGSGGIELGFAQAAPEATIVCLDVNPNLIQLGRDQARERGLAVTFEEADLNTATLPRAEFDIVFCHASLHHLSELEHIMAQIGHTLRLGGELITVDVITDQGYRMRPETRTIVQDLWRTLPKQYRINHTAYGEPRYDAQIWEADTSASGMECVRSQDILPLLERSFAVTHFVPYHSISRRFFDTMYGPNYDLDRPLDRAIFDWIWELDQHYLTAHQLRPETFFGVYRNREG